LASKNLRLSAADLFSNASNFPLKFGVSSVLLVEEEAGVVRFLLEALEVYEVAIVSCLEVVILKKFFILKVTVLGLDGVELIAQGKVVFVSLLDFEDLRFELADEQVFLV
jgi:hypothetical protein